MPPQLSGAPAAALRSGSIDGFDGDARIGLNDSLEYQSAGTIAAQLADDKATGAGEVRLALYIDPNTGAVLDPNTWQALPDGIAHYDAIFRAAQTAGEPLSVVLIPSHDALFDAVQSGNAAGFGQAYANQTGQIAAHLSQFGVRDFELGNEPNDAASWPIDYGNKSAAAAQYMALEAPAYDAIKAAIGADSRVVMAGLSMCDADYLQALYDHGLAGHTDAVNFHPYDMGSTPDEMRAHLDRMHAVMQANGDSSPVWLTELGSQSSGGGEAAQAEYVQTALSSLPGYVSKAFWFNMQDWPGNTWGLERQDGSHKAAYGAFQAMATALNAQGVPAPAVDPAFSAAYAGAASALGAPTGEAFSEANGNLKQLFERGYMLRAPDGSVYVRGLDNSDLTSPTPPGPFDAAIAQYGARLGPPTSGVYAEPNGNLKQTFANGYILRAPDGTLYVRDLANQDLTASAPVPTPQPPPAAPSSSAVDPFGAQRTIHAPELGAQTSGVFEEPNGNLKQTFANGYLLQAPDGTVYVRRNDGGQLWQSAAVDADLREAYQAQATVLGAPEGEAFREDNGNLKQVFDGGYILRAPDGSVFARSLANQPL